MVQRGKYLHWSNAEVPSTRGIEKLIRSGRRRSAVSTVTRRNVMVMEIHMAQIAGGLLFGFGIGSR